MPDKAEGVRIGGWAPKSAISAIAPRPCNPAFLAFMTRSISIAQNRLYPAENLATITAISGLAAYKYDFQLSIKGISFSTVLNGFSPISSKKKH